MGAECLADLGEIRVRHPSSPGTASVDFAVPSGNTRKVDSFTADQPVLSSSSTRIGSLYCFDTANTELGPPK